MSLCVCVRVCAELLHTYMCTPAHTQKQAHTHGERPVNLIFSKASYWLTRVYECVCYVMPYTHTRLCMATQRVNYNEKNCCRLFNIVKGKSSCIINIYFKVCSLLSLPNLTERLLSSYVSSINCIQVYLVLWIFYIWLLESHR